MFIPLSTDCIKVKSKRIYYQIPTDLSTLLALPFPELSSSCVSYTLYVTGVPFLLRQHTFVHSSVPCLMLSCFSGKLSWLRLTKARPCLYSKSTYWNPSVGWIQFKTLRIQNGAHSCVIPWGIYEWTQLDKIQPWTIIELCSNLYGILDEMAMCLSKWNVNTTTTFKIHGQDFRQS